MLLNEKKIYQTTKGKVMISSLVFTMLVAGYTFKLNNDSNNNKSELISQYDIVNEVEKNRDVDWVLGFDDINKSISGEDLDFSYYIDDSNVTNATLAHVLDEVTFTNDKGIFDNKEKLNNEVFYYPPIQPIIVPEALEAFGVEDMLELTSRLGKYQLTVKKLLTMDGETMYYQEAIFIFNKNAETLKCEVEEGDFMQAQTLHKLREDGMWEELYRNQTGVYQNGRNIIENNYNNENKIIVPIEESPFAETKGKYDMNYLREAADLLDGEDNFYSEENEGKDFSAYKKY